MPVTSLAPVSRMVMVDHPFTSVLDEFSPISKALLRKQHKVIADVVHDNLSASAEEEPGQTLQLSVLPLQHFSFPMRSDLDEFSPISKALLDKERKFVAAVVHSNLSSTPSSEGEEDPREDKLDMLCDSEAEL